MDSPVRSSRPRVAGTGPMPITSGSTPATLWSPTRASTSRPWSSANASLVTSVAAAPSEIWLALPGVTVPSLLKTVGSWLRASREVSRRMPSSSSTSPSSVSTGTTWSSKRPSSVAAAARCWLWSAYSSCCSREMPWRSATASAVIPIWSWGML